MVLEATGGAPGVRDLNALKAALDRPFSGFGDVQLFPTVFLKAAALGHGIATAHPFVDGNKRTALLATAALLELHGWALCASAGEQESTLVSLALKQLSLEDFARWLEEHSEPT
jgi:death-on-curing protein